MPGADLVAVIVTYNRLDKLEASLGALLGHGPDRLAGVVVVDNASTDGTAAWLAEQTDPRVRVHRLPANLGGAGGFAAGFEAAQALFDPDWLLVMDDDAAPAPGTLARFHETARNGADGWAGAVFLPSGEISDMNRPLHNPFWSLGAFLRTALRGREGFHLGAAEYAAEARPRVDVASFVGLFLSRAALRRGGLPDARLFLYGDDTLYTLRLSRIGCVLRFDPALVFVHDCDTLADRDQVIRPFWRAYFYHRNLLMVYRAAAGPLIYPLVRAIKLRGWRRRAPAYGPDRDGFLALLDRADRDAAARRLGVTREHIAAAFPGGERG